MTCPSGTAGAWNTQELAQQSKEFIRVPCSAATAHRWATLAWDVSVKVFLLRLQLQGTDTSSLPSTCLRGSKRGQEQGTGTATADDHEVPMWPNMHPKPPLSRILASDARLVAGEEKHNSLEAQRENKLPPLLSANVQSP